MTEAAAAMGLTNLESLDEFVAINRRNYHDYRAGLEGIPGVSLISYDESGHCNYQYIAVQVDEQVAGVSRDDLIRVLEAEYVLARRYFWPGCHRMEPYRSFFPNAGLLLEETERIAACNLVLPTGTAVGPQQIATICEIIRLCVGDSQELLRFMAEREVRSVTERA
jgi:dTDP-4-amino-4,6-dideoxygalactose transaminase